METKFNVIDENEARIDFEGSIQIIRSQYPEFNQEMQELIEKYAI